MNIQQMFLLRQRLENAQNRYFSRHTPNALISSRLRSSIQAGPTTNQPHHPQKSFTYYGDEDFETMPYDYYYGDAGHEHDLGPIGWVEQQDGTEIEVFEARTSDGNIVYVSVDSREEISVSAKQEVLVSAKPSTPPVEASPQPPINAEFVLHFLLSRDEQDAVIGDLLERYLKKCERLGVQRANLWFYGEVVRSLWPLIKRAVTKASGLLALGAWIRRHIS